MSDIKLTIDRSNPKEKHKTTILYIGDYSYRLKLGDILLHVLETPAEQVSEALAQIDKILAEISILPIEKVLKSYCEIIWPLGPKWFRHLLLILPIAPDMQFADEKFDSIRYTSEEVSTELHLQETGFRTLGELLVHKNRNEQRLAAMAPAGGMVIAWKLWKGVLEHKICSDNCEAEEKQLLFVEDREICERYVMLAEQHFKSLRLMLNSFRSMQEQLPISLDRLSKDPNYRFRRESWYDLGISKAVRYGQETEYRCGTLNTLLAVELDMVRAGKPHFARCQNCNRYFFKISSRNEYCKRNDPASGLPCNKVGPKKRYAKELQEDMILAGYRKAYKSYFKWVKDQNQVLDWDVGVTEFDISKLRSDIGDHYNAWYNKAADAVKLYKAGKLSGDDTIAAIRLPPKKMRSKLYADYLSELRAVKGLI